MLEQFNEVVAGLKKNYQNLPEAIDQLDDKLSEMVKKLNSGKDVAEAIVSAQSLVKSIKDDLTEAAAKVVAETAEQASKLIDTVQEGLQKIEDGVDAVGAEAKKLVEESEKAEAEKLAVEAAEAQAKADAEVGEKQALEKSAQEEDAADDSEEKKSKKSKSKE